MSSLWVKIKGLFAHSRTILAARLYSLVGFLLIVHDSVGSFLSGQDFMPLSTRLMDALHVAPDLRGLVWGLVLSGTGLLFEWLRRITTQSVSENKMDAAIADAKAALPPGTLQP